jgi:hypothetical protein
MSTVWHRSCFLKEYLRRPNRARIPQVPKEHDNEECKAGSEDRDSDRRNDWRFCGSQRSTGPLR